MSGFPGWVVWLFVHIAFLNGFGNRFGALWRWARSMIGRARPERVFSVGHTGGDERRYHCSGSVDVVHAPAAKPGAVGFLLAHQPVQPAPGRRMCRQVFTSEHLENVGSHVCAGRVDHLAEIAERQLRAQRPGVVGVESAPAAIFALHPD